ncbi:MAG: glycosyltransferase family 4 protein, partial [Caldilineaceae bacterium]|nr:glycosyltransferase family 4 protein [Caldilineaceae bacterium]
MAKVLLIGYNPPHFVPNIKIEAAHYRTWQFLDPLLADGHTVCLCAGARNETGDQSTMPAKWQGYLEYQPIAFGHRGWVQQLQRVHDAFQPDCVLAINFSHCLYTTKLQTHAPMWMDIYGDMVTIVQAAAYRARADRGIHTSLGFLQRVLAKGDVFSGCGLPQQHMMVGELAMAGRLNHRTFGYPFVRTVPPGSPPSPAVAIPRVEPRNLLATQGIREEDFVVLWCGGYNTWTDVDTLFKALTVAMAENPALHYVSVGANTYEAPDNVYTRLLALIDKSPYRHRFHLLGWRPWSEIPTFYRESDVGINIDALHYETIYGTRTRLVEMIASGLPVITSLGAELSYLLRDRGAALTFEVGDWQSMGEQIGKLAQNNALREQMAHTAHEFANTVLSFAATTKAVREWVRQPAPA